MEDGKAQLQTLILRSFKKGKKCYLTMLQGRRCILGKLTWWSARQLQGEVIFSAQAPHPWWCLSSEGWGAAEGHKWQNCGPSRHSLPPAALCHYGGIAATICDIHKVANSAEGCFLSILFSCQFPMRMRRKEKRNPEILRWYNLQLSTETPESWSLGLFSLVYLVYCPVAVAVVGHRSGICLLPSANRAGEKCSSSISYPLESPWAGRWVCLLVFPNG